MHAATTRATPVWALAIVLVLAAACPATAQDDARCVDVAAPSDSEVTARIAELRALVASHEPDMRHWFSAFSVIFATLMGGELTVALTAADEGPRIDGIVSTVSLGLGLITQLVTFPPLLGVGGTLDAMPESTPEERVAKLARAEAMVARSAEAVRFGRGPLGPSLSGLYSIAANTFLLVGFSRTVAAYIGVAGGLVLGQGRILVMPDGIDRAWRAYQRRYPDAGCAPGAAPSTTPAIAVTPAAFPAGAGLSLSLTF